MDCIFNKLNIVIKITLICIPIILGVGVGFVLWGLNTEGIFGTVFLIGGILSLILGLVIPILIYYLYKEKNKVFTNFQQIEEKA